VDLGRIDVEVQHALRLGRELLRHGRDAIVEARAERDQEIAIVHGVVRARGAVHAEHVQRQRLRRVERAETHQCRGHGNLERARERTQRRARVAVDHAAAGVYQRAFALAEHREELRAAFFGERLAFDCGEPPTVARDRQVAVAMERADPVLNVFRDVDHDGAGSARTRDLERRAHRRLEPQRIGHEEHVLRDRTHERADRRFLERVGADGAGRDLPADHDDRNGVGHAVAHRRHAVRRAGSRRDHHDADAPARARVAGGHEPRALLVRGHDQRHRLDAAVRVRRVVAEHRVVSRQDRAAAVAENRLDALVGEHLNDDIGAGHLRAGERVGGA
jgi:hypothetical protein